MKKFILLISALVLSGCDISGAIVARGEPCPGDPTLGTLSYIGDREKCNASKADACEFESGTTDFSYYFTQGYCPEKYPHCISEETENGIEYHCAPESVIQIQCGENTFQCGEGEDQRCVDYTKDATCGAYDCDAVNYGGKNCKLNGSRCDLTSEGTYACLCANGELDCDDTCVDPSSETTCGASNCDEMHYGGDDCTAYEDDRRCVKGEDNTYSCECRKGYILCDGKCISPNYSDTNCGARGACNSEDQESTDFMGINCEAGGGMCQDAQCSCPVGYWCTLEGNDKPECVNPGKNPTCNATVDPETGICTVTPCDDTSEVCVSSTLTEYFCRTTSCSETEQLCPEDTNNVCYPIYDIKHCGSCSKNCNDASNDVYQAVGCEDDQGKASCTFECLEDLTNCGTPFAPLCIDTRSNISHCGQCNNKCSSSQYCENGQCIDTDCAANECTSKDEFGEQSCINTDTHCGPNCTSCENIHDNAYCLNGECVMTACKEEEHPIFNHANQIVECVRNSVTACAPFDRKTSDPIVDCEATKDVNAHAVECTLEGYCRINSCKPGFHLSVDGKSCIVNTPASCGSTTSSETVDCTLIENAATTLCQDNGTCVVSTCYDDYHLSKDNRSCIANSNTACAPNNSNMTEDCQAMSNAASTQCHGGKCKILACNTNYHPNTDYTQCVNNTTTACASPTGNNPVNCNDIGNSNATICDEGVCKVTACATNYHPNSSFTTCIPNSNTDCASTTNPTTKNCNDSISYSAETKCEAGVCKVVDCEANYHPNSNYTACTANSATACGTTASSTKNCNEYITNSASTTCEAATCKVTACADNYHPNASFTACIANSALLCASTTSSSTKNCNDSITNSASTECNAGSCKVIACAAGYHPNANFTACEPNSNTACASTTSAATKNCNTFITNSATTKCDAGICKVTACVSNYHPSSDYTSCTANTTAACGSTTSATTKNCSTSISNSASTKCESGTCKVTACATNYHPNTSMTGCIENSATACASTTSSSTVNCNNTLSNTSTTVCTAGVCKVKACATDYHPNAEFTKCVQNTATACASTTSSTTKNCNTSIANSATTTCTAGTCKVTKCSTNYHITDSNKTSCTKNSNTSCASTTSYSPKNCTTGVATKCVSGACACSTDGSTVLNYNNTTCIRKACKGFYGALASTASTSATYCVVTKCHSDFVTDYTSGNSWGTCRPKGTTESYCNGLPGWKTSFISGGQCWANSCESGYTKYHATCHPTKYVCGATGYNCDVQGKTCNTDTGKCE